MNINPVATRILCYGDSNTWGQNPDMSGRYPADVRWTGALQSRLGSDYEVIEEGLPSRTTDLEYDRRPGRNGKTYLVPCLSSHLPIDIVILMLGTNDLKAQFARNANDVAEAIRGLVSDIREYGRYVDDRAPRIVLISPIHINTTAPDFMGYYAKNYDVSSASESRRLAPALAQVAEETDSLFIDAASVARAGIDGVHLDSESHAALAKLIADML